VSEQMYRLFDSEGELLYIGISYSAIARFAQHKASKAWIGDVVRIDIETHHCSRSEMLKRERDAITNENPKHNIKRCGGASTPTGATRPGFDHMDLARDPRSADAYRKLVEAVDAVQWKIEEHDHRGVVMTVVHQILDALQMPDQHHECTAGGEWTMKYPIKHDGEQWAWYHCDHCGQYWTCGY
jgi:predicted GIY-YIG superfamily endonuclease